IKRNRGSHGGQTKACTTYESSIVPRKDGYPVTGGMSVVEVVGIRFKKAGKIYYFDPGDLALDTFSHAIVETARGVEYGQVVVGKKMVTDHDVVFPLKKVIR